MIASTKPGTPTSRNAAVIPKRIRASAYPFTPTVSMRAGPFLPATPEVPFCR
jgi:hypothetical protein